MVYNSLRQDDAGDSAVPMEPPYRLLALGRLVQKKGFDVLINACKALEERGLQIQLTVGGSGPMERRLRRLTRNLGMDGRVTFPGHVRRDRVPVLLRNADVFVMPSVVAHSGDRDGIPNVILEALSWRLPVVATDVCGIGEVIRDGETGLLVPERDPLALAGAIAEITANRGRALEMAESGRRLVRERFDAENNGRSLFQLLQDAAVRT
jgi:glycosyltransferase involved in cell wall biosynthesis